ncbi:hypothetical protein M876_14265 [Elizabethkingia anophelis FMS-007]|nr:hypothetical protein M876_14265 [Elizabethkingia anophelis FMS-007]EQB92989.1 hypothetical protein C874_16495 [Elizabethkingia anophelis 502]
MLQNLQQHNLLNFKGVIIADYRCKTFTMY